MFRADSTSPDPEAKLRFRSMVGPGCLKEESWRSWHSMAVSQCSRLIPAWQSCPGSEVFFIFGLHMFQPPDSWSHSGVAILARCGFGGGFRSSLQVARHGGLIPAASSALGKKASLLQLQFKIHLLCSIQKQLLEIAKSADSSYFSSSEGDIAEEGVGLLATWQPNLAAESGTPGCGRPRVETLGMGKAAAPAQPGTPACGSPAAGTPGGGGGRPGARVSGLSARRQQKFLVMVDPELGTPGWRDECGSSTGPSVGGSDEVGPATKRWSLKSGKSDINGSGTDGGGQELVAQVSM
eukprot:g43854.t1